MENSFFEYRDKTRADSGSDSEIIDDSMVLESVPYSTKKKNRTAFVAESDESLSNDDDKEESVGTENILKMIAKGSNAGGVRLFCSSEDDGSRRSSLRKSSFSQNNVVVSSSEDEADYSPELIPRRPLPRQKLNNPNESLILQRTKKRMLFQDSDTDNSIIIEQRKSNKLKCLKDTPLKIVGKAKIDDVDKSINDESCDGEDDENDSDDNKSCDYEDENDNNLSDTSLDKKVMIGNDASDNENYGASNKSDTVASNINKLIVSSGESSDNDNNVANKQQSNIKMIKKSKKLMISSDDSDDDNISNSKIIKGMHQNNTNIAKKTKKLAISSDDDDNEEIISKIKTTDISTYNDKSEHDYSNNNEVSQECDGEAKYSEGDYDDGPDEDLMVMSRATRMSIMGMIPKDNDSDDSDFIKSDSSSQKTEDNIAGSFENLQNVDTKFISDAHEKLEQSNDNLPEVTVNLTQGSSVKTDDEEKEITHNDSILSNESRISCSPFSSPLQDITNRAMEKSRRSRALDMSNKLTDFMDLTKMPEVSEVKAEVIDLSNIDPSVARDEVLNNPMNLMTKQEADDDVTIINTTPEIIALSSDDEDEAKADKNARASQSKLPLADRTNLPQESMKQHLAPSRPGQVVYVKKHVKENELNKLMRLKEDLNNVRVLLDEMELESLPDGGSRLLARHGALEAEVRRQGDRVANMVVEPDQPSAADVANDGYDTGLSWDDIQKGSNAVQPRMFGRQAMATHMAERNLILERLRDLHAALGSRPDEAAQAPAPRALRSTLLPYQRHALAWLRWRETQKPAAGILADDMGLGKTITIISLVASDKEDRIDHGDEDDDDSARDNLARGGTLVVCPASLLQQWAGEVGKHCAAHALSVCLHHGAARATRPHRLAAHDLVVTTYNILQRDSGADGVLRRVRWRRVVLDEAHIVRNHKAATSAAVCALRAARRWCLTGTPVHNKDLDLFALLKFLRLSPFDDLQMWKKWIDNKSQGGQERLNIIMQCILLRRTKQQLQEKGQLTSLPARSEHARLVTLASDEMNVYQKVLVLSKTLFAQFLHQRAEKNSGTAPAPANAEYEKMHKRMIALQGVKPVKSHEILVLLLRLRQVCCHCGLIGSMLDEATPGAQPEEAGADLLRELDKLSLEDSRRKSNSKQPEDPEEDAEEESAKADEAIRAVLTSSHPVFQLSRPSSKITAVMDCLEEHVFTNKGDKAVIVSQWTSVLNLVEKELSKKKVRSVTLSGAVPVAARPRLIDQLNDSRSDVKVMLLSLCAGGVGINLCGANHLLLLDPHWNPQLEQQAQDRVYRLGQSKHVHVYRFVCVDTVEQSIRRLQEAKLQLADNVLTGAGNKAGSPLSVEELKMLFNMGT